MKKRLYKKALALLLTFAAITAMTGCATRKTSDSQEYDDSIVYVDADGDGVAETPENEAGEVKDVVPQTGTGSSNAGKIDMSKEEELTGEFELQIFTGGYGNAIWEYAIEKFQSLHPDLEINAHLDANVNTQMKTRWAKDNPPDFVFFDGTDIPKETWMEEGKLLNLADIYHEGKVYGTDTLIKDHLKTGLTSSYMKTNRVYEMPVLFSTYGLWYDEAYTTMPKNYEELTSMAADGKTMIYPGKYSGYLVWGLLMPAVASNAMEDNDRAYFTDVLNAANGEVFQDARFKSAMEKIEALAKTNFFDKASLSMDHITSQSAWLKHQTQFIPNGLWLENEMKDSIPSGFQMRYYPAALQDADQQTCIIAASASVGISSKGKNPEAAKAFLRFLYTDDLSIKFAELCGSPSATRTDVSKSNLTDTAKQVNELINSGDAVVVPKGSTSWGSVDSVINDCINQIIDGKMTAAQACDKLTEATNKKNR